ncbi:MAG TPA: CoA transferase [Amycolatopsis sp.]|nr:CoA transferase [Amycolatopsis sp.]
MRQVLSGIRVVELAGTIAAAYCGKLFADLGADVLKVEPPWGDELRHGKPLPGDPSGAVGSGAFLHLNTNKRSVVLDHDVKADRDRLRVLIEDADLVIESRPQGPLSDWGVGWESLAERAPGVSVVCISGFGVDGPYAGYLWDDIVVQAMSGVLLLQNDPSFDPLRLPGHVAMCLVGHQAALGALSAVMSAQSGGAGSFVDCAAVEALTTTPGVQAALLSYEYRGQRLMPPDVLASGTDTLIPTGVFPCADGYVAMMSTPQQVNEMLEVLGDDDARAAFTHPDAFSRPETKEALDVAVYSWLATHTRAEATAEAQRAGWPLAGVNVIAETLAADHLHQRGFWVHVDDPSAGALDLPGPWCRFGEGGWALRRLAPSLGEHDKQVEQEATAIVSQGDAHASRPAPEVTERAASAVGPPLEGVRVVDLTTVWAGPYATMLLADLGAEVIRIENPFVLPPTTKGYYPRPVLTNPGRLGSMYGPPAPGRPDRPWNRHAMNNSIARNKLSATMDTRRREARELVMRLAEISDVFIDSFKANGLARIGIQVSELQARNPSLVIVRLPPAGLTGDWSGYTGFGAQFDGLTGFSSICGHRDSDLTTSPSTTYMDFASGPAAAFATVAALRYRAATGRGQFVELSQSENVINHLGDVFVDCQQGVEPARYGNRHHRRAPQGLYRCAGENRWLAISVGDDEQWRALASLIGHPDLADDPRFGDEAARRTHHDELDRLIGDWTARQQLIEAFHVLQAAGVPAGPLLDEQLFVADPHFAQRGFMQPLTSADVGTHPHPGFAFRGVPQVWRRGSPTLGQDNEYVYKSLLGVSDEAYERYRAENILSEDYLAPDGTPY